MSRSRNHLKVLLLLAVALLPVAASVRAAVISEVFLPASGFSGIEISGVNSAGAVLLRVDARPGEGLRILDEVILSGRPDQTDARGEARLAVDLIVEGDQDAAGNWTGGDASVLPPDTRVTTVTAGSLRLGTPAALLVLLEGQQPPPLTRQLADPGPAYTLAPGSPIVDWVAWAPGASAAEARQYVEQLSQDAAETLNITDLPRPLAPTGSGNTGAAEVLVRPRGETGYLAPWFWAGAGNVLEAGPDFSPYEVTPGRLNPALAALPEPAAGVLLTTGLLALGGRRGSKRSG